MPIPELLSTGLLPRGLYDATLGEIREAFGFQNEQRQTLQQGLEELARAVISTGMFFDLIVDGSYVTHKEFPNDIDVILRTRGDYWTAIVALEKDPYNRWLTESDEVKQRHGVQAFIDDAGGQFLEFFSLLKAEDALEHGVSPTTQRGLIRVPL